MLKTLPIKSIDHQSNREHRLYLQVIRSVKHLLHVSSQLHQVTDSEAVSTSDTVDSDFKSQEKLHRTHLNHAIFQLYDCTPEECALVNQFESTHPSS